MTQRLTALLLVLILVSTIMVSAFATETTPVLIAPAPTTAESSKRRALQNPLKMSQPIPPGRFWQMNR